ncbi:hypothetical protein LXA43DRAFT_991115 [Ganoderma leucocontextum]|nr:hypothetical protein LXA43DRAFT_991115 [Ganoderma leucocontextum]
MFPSIEVPASSTHQHPLSYMVMPGGLFEDEYFWRDHQTWLEESGYMLRPRYRVDWEPSWLKSNKDFLFCEDGKGALVSRASFEERLSL